MTVPFVVDWANKSGKTAMHVAAQEGNEVFARVSDDSLRADLSASWVNLS